MINKRNGHLNISDEIELAPSDTFEKINNLKLGEIQEVRDMGNSYKWLDTRNVKIEKEYYNLSFCFFNEGLKMLIFRVDDRKFDLKEDFGDTWSEQNEKTKELKYKKWVIDELGREGQFSWGQVSADYDSKDGSSSIVINYDSTSKRTSASWINKLMTLGQK